MVLLFSVPSLANRAGARPSEPSRESTESMTMVVHIAGRRPDRCAGAPPSACAVRLGMLGRGFLRSGPRRVPPGRVHLSARGRMSGGGSRRPLRRVGARRRADLRGRLQPGGGRSRCLRPLRMDARLPRLLATPARALGGFGGGRGCCSRRRGRLHSSGPATRSVGFGITLRAPRLWQTLR